MEDLLGRVKGIKRGKLYFKPDELRLSLSQKIKGRLKLAIWTLGNPYLAKVFLRLQRFRPYRYFIKWLIRNRISFFVGTSLIKNSKTLHNLCYYQGFDDFLGDFAIDRGLYNIQSRIKNTAVGNITILLENTDNSWVCTLSNFIVRIPFRGANVGTQLLDKAMFLCKKMNLKEIKVVLPEDNQIARHLFLKSGFQIASR